MDKEQALYDIMFVDLVVAACGPVCGMESLREVALEALRE